MDSRRSRAGRRVRREACRSARRGRLRGGGQAGATQRPGDLMTGSESEEGGDVTGGRQQAVLAGQHVDDRACFAAKDGSATSRILAKGSGGIHYLVPIWN